MMNTTTETVKHYRRHLFFLYFLRFITGPIVKLVFGYRCTKERGPQTPSIIISNHNSNLDPILVMMSFTGHSYFVASEHAFRKGFLSRILTFVFDPIPLNKAQADAYTLKEIFRRLKAGFNVCLFAEGNRSFNGVTGNLTPATAKMVKISGAALITYRLEGIYFSAPRWSNTIRRGKTAGRVTGRYSAETLQSMTTEQILELIKQGIHEDAYQRQRENPIPYRGKNPAEHIETVLYLCPACKKPGTIHSRGDHFSCGCGLSAVYTETGFLAGEAPFSTITEWDKWQTEYLPVIVSSAGDEPICTDDDQMLFKVDSASRTVLAGKGPMYISRTEFHCAGMVFSLQEIKQCAIVGKMTLQFALKDGTQYEVQSAVPRSALKYLEILRILKG